MGGDKTKQDIDSKYYKSIAVVLVIIVGVFCTYYFNFQVGWPTFSRLTFSEDPAVWGQFGDFIGGVLNPLIAFFAFVALIVAITKQLEGLNLTRKELELTRQELELTRVELERSSDAQRKQAQHFEREEIKTDLFRVIETLNNKLNETWGAEVEGVSLSMCSKTNNLVELLVLKKRIQQKDSALFESVFRPFVKNTFELLNMLEKYQEVNTSSVNDLVAFFEQEALDRYILVEHDLIENHENTKGYVDELLNKHTLLEELISSYKLKK